jgi:hypothetical protein
MKKKLLNYFQKRYNLNFLMSILSYIIPISIFGHWNIYSLIYFHILILSLSYLIYYRAIEGIDWPSYLSCSLFGFSLPIYGITMIGITMEGSIIQITTYSGILCLISIVPFSIFIAKYRDDIKREYDLSFTDEKSRDRDIKLMIG